MADAITARTPITVELLYSDLAGYQRTITRFSLLPAETSDAWLTSMSRHWFLDRESPRPESEIAEVVHTMRAEIEATSGEAGVGE